MRELRDSFNSLAKTPQILADRSGYMPLPFGAYAFQKAMDQIRGEYSFVRARVSLSITKERSVLALTNDNKPHDSVEIHFDTPELPDVISDELEDDVIHLTCREPILFDKYYDAVQGVKRAGLIVGLTRLDMYALANDNNFSSGLRAMSSENHSPLPLQRSGGGYEALACRIVFDANTGYATENVASIELNSFSKARQLVGKAGRSKPQGDLILYFGESSCLAEGVNAVGDVTLELTNAAKAKDVSKYEGPENGVYKAVFSYADVFNRFISTRGGNLPPVNMAFGVDEDGYPVIEADYEDYMLRYVNRNSSCEFLEEYPEMSASRISLAAHQPVQSEPEVPEDIPVEQPQVSEEVDSSVADMPQVQEWNEAYVRQQTARSRTTSGGTVTDWFNAFLMEKVQAGEAVDQVHYDVYNTVK